MSEDLRIDSHKLIYHPERVACWLGGGNIYPIEAEVSLSGACNHRCKFCALEYTEYKPVFLDKALILDSFEQMAQRGLKSVIFSGEGEPLLHKDAPEVFIRTKELGLDLAMSTNGVLLTRDVAERCLSAFTWIRFSVSAGRAETYHSIHNGRPGDFERVMANLAAAVEIKRKRGLPTTLGVQLLLIRDNLQEALLLARRLKEIGLDYFTVKPFSRHPKSEIRVDLDFDYRDCLGLEDELKELEDPSFQVLFRSNSMKKLLKEKKYEACHGLPFFTHIDASGDVWPCVALLGEKEFCFGNLARGGFASVWEGEQRKRATASLEARGIAGCRELCRLDEINDYLHELRHPGGHVNFI